MSSVGSAVIRSSPGLAIAFGIRAKAGALIMIYENNCCYSEKSTKMLGREGQEVLFSEARAIYLR